MSEKAFYSSVTHALMGCQLVEQQLKLYIAQAFDLVRKRLGDRIPFKMSGDDYEDAPLERLVKVFGKLTNNGQLLADIRKFKDERNYLSHKGIAHCLNPDNELMDDAMEEFNRRLIGIRLDAERLQQSIHEEANNFRGFLWFEDDPASSSP
jgi:L-fucose isomerase-like protein